MLLRTKPIVAGLALALVGPACDGSECDSATPLVSPIGAELFMDEQVGEVGPFVLFRADKQVQLLGGPKQAPTLEVRATLLDEASDTIEQAESALASGEELGSFDPACLGFIDKPRVTLSLGVAHASMSFSYPFGCPPSGLAQVDTMLRELQDSMPTCRPTPLVSECEIISE